jgi:hypothetical protein
MGNAALSALTVTSPTTLSFYASTTRSPIRAAKGLVATIA